MEFLSYVVDLDSSFVSLLPVIKLIKYFIKSITKLINLGVVGPKKRANPTLYSGLFIHAANLLPLR